jgi:hypothetical protein
MKIDHSSSRREFVKKAAYMAPAILTLQAAPAYVKAGSGDNRGGDNRGGDNRGGDNRGGDNRGRPRR